MHLETDVCAPTAVFLPCTGSFLRGCCKSSRFLSGPPAWRWLQSQFRRVPSRDPAYQQKPWVGHLNFWYRVLKKKNFWDLPSSRVAKDSHPSTKQSLLPVSLFYFFCPPGAKTAFYSTLDLNQGTWHEKGVELNQEEAWPRQRSSGDHCHTPRLHSYLPVWCYKTDTVPLFSFLRKNI